MIDIILFTLAMYFFGFWCGGATDRKGLTMSTDAERPVGLASTDGLRLAAKHPTCQTKSEMCT